MLFANRWQAKKVRWLTAGFMLWMVAFLAWAWSLAHSYGLSPGDGGVLRPPSERLIAAGLVALVGVLPAAGMWIYSRLYLVHIARDGGDVELTTIGLLRPRTVRVPVSDFTATAYHHGQMTGRVSVNAPWTTLRVAGRRLPFIVDQQAEHIETAAINALARARPESQRRRGRRTKRA